MTVRGVECVLSAALPSVSALRSARLPVAMIVLGAALWILFWAGIVRRRGHWWLPRSAHNQRQAERAASLWAFVAFCAPLLLIVFGVLAYRSGSAPAPAPTAPIARYLREPAAPARARVRTRQPGVPSGTPHQGVTSTQERQ